MKKIALAALCAVSMTLSVHADNSHVPSLDLNDLNSNRTFVRQRVSPRHCIIRTKSQEALEIAEKAAIRKQAAPATTQPRENTSGGFFTKLWNFLCFWK